jgi:predicted RecB family nuclease
VADAVDLRRYEAPHDDGVMTVGELRSLDPATARYSALGMPALPEHIDLARAALGRHPVYRRRGVAGISVPRADVEVDVDMENAETGVYLWGNLVTRRDGWSGTPGSVPFATWEPMTPEAEAGNTLRFWRWLVALKSETAAAGRTFRAYCWNAAAENRYLRRLGLAEDLTEAVEKFIASDQWVDLLKVWDSQLITGGPSTLKVIAPLAGAGWAVDDPGGGQSMVHYDMAVSGEGDDREAARAWLLGYNRDDVTATYRVREWMSAACVPGVETIGPDLREPA